MPTIKEKDHPRTKITKARPAPAEMKMPGPRTSEVPQSPYTQEEAAIVGRIKTHIGGKLENIAQTADEKRYNIVLPETVLTRRKAIVKEIADLVNGILVDRTKRTKTHSTADFETYVDTHIDESDYLFLTAKPLGINVNGWGLFAGLLNPLELGEKIGPNEDASRPSNWRSGH